MSNRNSPAEKIARRNERSALKEKAEGKVDLKTIEDLKVYIAQTIELSNDLQVQMLKQMIDIQKATAELAKQVERFADENPDLVVEDNELEGDSNESE